MSNHNRGLRALAMKDADIINFPTAKTPAVPASEELDTKLEVARERREVAQENTNESDTALAPLQERYVVCAEPPAIYDKVLKKFLKEQGFKLLYRVPKVRLPGWDKKRPLAEAFLDDENTTRCSSLTFRPGKDKIVGGCLNLWTPPDITGIQGDVSLFLEHLHYIFDGNEESIAFVLNWMALTLQKRGTKMESALLIVGPQGTGKTTLAIICRRCHGISNSAKIKGDDLIRDFNEYMMQATLVVVEEVYLKGRWDLMDRIKDTITSSKTRINIKHVSPFEIENVANFMLFSNHTNALALPDDDRRWHVHVSHQPPKDNAYYDRLYHWLEEEDGYEKIYHFLMHRDLGHFNRHTRPPMTQSKKAMAFASKNDYEQRIFDDIEDRKGLFASDLVVLEDVFNEYAKVRFSPNHTDISAIRHAMNHVGATTGRRVRIRIKQDALYDQPERIIEQNLRLWAVRDKHKWFSAEPEAMRKELKKTKPNIILDDD